MHSVNAQSVHNRKQGYTIIEVLVSSFLLAISFSAVLSTMLVALRGATSNSLNTVALFSAEQSIEQLRFLGKSELTSRLTLDNSGAVPIWTYDPVADGTLNSQLIIRQGYVTDAAGTAIMTSNSVAMTQQCMVYAADFGGAPDPAWVTVSLDVQWTFGNRTYSDSLSTIIE